MMWNTSASRRPARPARPRRASFQPRVEGLEERLVPASALQHELIPSEIGVRLVADLRVLSAGLHRLEVRFTAPAVRVMAADLEAEAAIVGKVVAERVPEAKAIATEVAKALALGQPGDSALAQANQTPQQVLRLLQ